MPVERAHPRARDPADRGARRDRHVRRVVRGRRAAPRGAHDRHPLDGPRDGRLLPLSPAPGPRSAHSPTGSRARERPPDFEEFDYRTALVPIFGDDVSASALRSAAKLIGERRRRLRDLRAAGAQPALARRRAGGGGGARALGARERAHPGAPRRHQDPHRPDPHAQPRAPRSSRKPSGSART